jgi:hypothetical protein
MRTLGLAFSLVGSMACAGRSARLETVDPHTEIPERRPPAISVDPTTRLPEPAATANARAALLVLSSPHELERVRQTVQQFFRALVHEVPTDLDALLTDQAWLDAAAGRLPARNAFRARFAQLDFSPLRGVMLYREPDLEIYRARDARALAAARSLPDDLRADEVLVRVHLAVSHAGKQRLFADEVTLTLRTVERGFRIARVAEDTPVP